jgi:plasmid stabilization system protein ParE
MQFAVAFHPKATRDVAEASDWYSQRSKRTSERFIFELDHVLHVISDHPELFETFGLGCRRALFRRFPYFVVYRFTAATIEVLAVAHAKRRPGFWRDRAG